MRDAYMFVLAHMSNTFLSELYYSRNVLLQLVSQQLILRYRRTVLGYLWTLINPLLMMTVMALVFSALYRVEFKSFAVFLFAGMIPWNFFSSVVTQSGTAFIQNEGLIKKIYLPKVLFPLSVALALAVDSVLSFVALFAIMIVLGAPFSWAVLFVIPAYMLLFFFALGVGLSMSVATVYFRDLQHVILIVMQGLFFLTPIIYKHDALTGKIGWIVGLNPVVPFIDIFRMPLYEAHLPSINIILQAVGISIGALVLGLSTFVPQQKKLVFRL